MRARTQMDAGSLSSRRICRARVGILACLLRSMNTVRNTSTSGVGRGATYPKAGSRTTKITGTEVSSMCRSGFPFFFTNSLIAASRCWPSSATAKTWSGFHRSWPVFASACENSVHAVQNPHEIGPAVSLFSNRLASVSSGASHSCALPKQRSSAERSFSRGRSAIVRALKNCGWSVACRYGTILRSTRGQSISRWYSSSSRHMTSSEPGKSAASRRLAAASLIGIIVEKYGMTQGDRRYLPNRKSKCGVAGVSTTILRAFMFVSPVIRGARRNPPPRTRS